MEAARELASIGVVIDGGMLRYHGKSYAIKDIQNIGYTAVRTKHSVNFVPTGTSFDASCRIFFLNGETLSISSHARRFLGDDSQAIFAPVWLTSEILSEFTFEERIARYERCFAERNFFEFGDYQIHRDGTIFRRARRVGTLTGTANQIRLGPFNLTAPSAGIGSVDVPMDVDRDCILYVLKNHYGLTWSGQRVRERRTDQRRRVYEGIIALGAKMAKADGVVSPDEIQAFKTFFQSDGFPVESVGTLFNAAVRDGRSISECASEIAGLINDDSLLDHLLIGLISIAWVDGVFHEAERRALFDVGRAFGMSTEEIEHFIQIYSAEAMSGTSGRRSKGERATDAAAHLQTLGLSPGASSSEVKEAYRKLAASFHPDLLRSKGVPDELVRIAEETLTKLNISYEWLRKNNYGTV